MRLPGPKNPKNWQNLHRVAKLGLGPRRRLLDWRMLQINQIVPDVRGRAEVPLARPDSWGFLSIPLFGNLSEFVRPDGHPGVSD
jgi:hypothetical protein